MKPLKISLLVAMIVALAWSAARGDEFHFAITSGDVAAEAVQPTPRQAILAPTPPESVKKVPADLVAPRYSVVQMGPFENRTSFVLMFEELDGKEPRLIVDANHNGDLTDDPPVVWRKIPYTAFNNQQYTRRVADVTLQVPYGSQTVPLLMHFVRMDSRDPNFTSLQDVLFYLPGYARTGKLKLGAETYNAALYDELANGDFRGNFSKNFSRTALCIDVNHNGRFDERGEVYETDKPFNIKGTTYELKVTDPAGGVIEVVKSNQTVPEILPPPDLGVGKPALPFAQPTLDGKTVRFPDDYKGKLVLLFFWGSWCPHCAEQIPFVVSAYRTYHSRGLEVLGITIEYPDKRKEFEAFIRSHNMTWSEVYSDKLWQAEIPQLYFIHWVPTPILVDGDTGKILAMRDDLLGDKLNKTLEKAFSDKKQLAEKK